MSAVPPIYTPGTNFATEASQPITVAGLPGAELDAEFTSIQETLGGVRSRLSEIQRDDGKMRNGVVGIEALSSSAIQALGSNALNPRGEWAALREYAIGDVFSRGEQTRFVHTPYTSGASYGSTDTSKTSIIGTPPDAGYVIRDVFSGDGVEDAFTLSVVPVYDTNVRVYVDGLFTLAGADWTLSGQNITFTSPPASGTDNIVMEIGQVSEVNTVAIPDETITTEKMADLAITTPKLANLAATSAKIADAAVTATKIATGAVISSKLADAAITEAKLASESVTSSKIATGAVGSAAVATGAITTSKIAPSAVATDAISNAAITGPKIAPEAVETAGLKDGNVTSVKIASESVTSAKIAPASVTAEKLSGAQTGTAPIFGARAWVTFDGQATTNNLNGTYNQVSTILTVSATDHGFRVNDCAYCNFTSGSAADGAYTVATVPDANTFTIVLGAATTSGNVTLARMVISGQGNVSSVVPSSPSIGGAFTLNFTLPMPSADYAVQGGCISYNSQSLYAGVSVQGENTTWAGPVVRKTVNSLSVLAGDVTAPYITSAPKEAYVVIYA